MKLKELLSRFKFIMGIKLKLKENIIIFMCQSATVPSRVQFFFKKLTNWTRVSR